uniref:(California timema) hypothetical protein n=1 Tax=Timema californicum TaxID=61474 RepID=A0A7R9J6J9_TIMCA|nr:unnamed protein product [Timema californicum]
MNSNLNRRCNELQNLVFVDIEVRMTWDPFAFSNNCEARVLQHAPLIFGEHLFLPATRRTFWACAVACPNVPLRCAFHAKFRAGERKKTMEEDTSQPTCEFYKMKDLLVEPCSLDPCVAEPHVVIVGAGIAGLAAASRLAKCNIQNFTILEASERPGGRINSCWLADSGAELGASWIYGGCVANPVFGLAAQEGLLRLPLNRIEGSHGFFYSSEGRAVDVNLSVRASKAFRLAEKAAFDLHTIQKKSNQDWSMQDFISMQADQELLRFQENERADASKVITALANDLRCRIGDDLSLVSAGQFGSFVNIPGGNIRVPLGYVGVLASLIRDIPDCSLRYCMPVQTIHWNATGATGQRACVSCANGEEISCDYVIFTSSLGVLKDQAAEMFSPPLPEEKMNAIKKLGFGTVNKIFMEYNRPFWLPKDGIIRLGWSPEQLEDRSEWVKGICTIEPSPGSKKVLCVWLGGPEAVSMEKCSNEEVAETITRVLRRFTGNTLIPFPNNLMRSSWALDLNFRGSLSYLGLESTPSHMIDLGIPVPESGGSLAPVILFAGEATHPGYYGTTHGALLSGVREADRIIQLTNQYKGPPQPREEIPT